MLKSQKVFSQKPNKYEKKLFDRIFFISFTVRKYITGTSKKRINFWYPIKMLNFALLR